MAAEEASSPLAGERGKIALDAALHTTHICNQRPGTRKLHLGDDARHMVYWHCKNDQLSPVHDLTEFNGRVLNQLWDLEDLRNGLLPTSPDTAFDRRESNADGVEYGSSD